MNKTSQRQIWVEIIKAVAIVWIFTNHISEKLFGSPSIANPSVDWPSLTERISQLIPLPGFGLWNVPVNVLRYIGWAGDQGVQLFLIASGFGLTWSLLNKQPGKPLKIFDFYLRRAERIYPLWWGVHILFISIWLLTGWGLSLFKKATILSLLGIRITPGLIYYFSPAWWYVGLILQLYLVYPMLWEALRRWGPAKLLIWSSVVAFSIRAAGLFLFKDYLDAWSRGAIFITRLPEFVFGICLASWILSRSQVTYSRLRSPFTTLLAVAVYILGMFLSLTLPGMIFAPFCLGAAAFILLYQLLEKASSISSPRWTKPIVWLGEHSYSIFLVHGPVILILVPFGIALSLLTSGRILLSILLTLLLALLLEAVVLFVTRVINNTVKKFGLIKTLGLAGLLGVTGIALLFGAELLVRRIDPQEILGWGERPSLQPDAQFGWKLQPSQTTRLRWESYDYFVTANSLGFPGPEYPVEKSPDTLRIMVTGDAFSSAEGVNTDQAWPRLLESGLSAKLGGKKVEVLNFAITGYGPNQYEAVIDHFAPIYRPDVILVEVFVNDFQDALSTNQDFQNRIGFGQRQQDSISSIIRLEQLRRWFEINREEPANEFITGKPREQGYILGNFKALERGNVKVEVDGRNITSQRLSQIQSTANQLYAKLFVVMVPASVQICGKNQLAYYPKTVNLADAQFYDIGLPQRMMGEITTSLHIPFYDLRGVLSGNANTCPYQPNNMHWTTAGHQLVANYLVGLLSRDIVAP